MHAARYIYQVYNQSGKKIDRETALQKAQKLKAEALDLSEN